MKTGNFRSAGGFKAKNPKRTVKRIFGYLFKYKARIVACMLFMLAGVFVDVGGMFMMTTAIDKFILPLVEGRNVTFGSLTGIGALGGFVGIMAACFVLGAVLHYANNLIIVGVSTKVLESIRNEMFEKMQKLPVRYFDSHTHGEIMSLYTNDTDTLREFISNGLPNIFSNVLTIVGMFVMMLVLSPLLTLCSVAILVLMLFIIKFIAGRSGKYFVKQQGEIGALNGYIEEHVEGLKVVKAFCHEEEEKQGFDEFNARLREASRKAHTYANSLMPIMGNLSYVSFAVTAIVGTILALAGGAIGISWGGLVAFMQASRQFSNPLAHIAQHINGVLMALAGAERIFALIDENAEADDGYVTLVNAKENEDGTIEETENYTGTWAWKHFHKAQNTTTYVKWTGKVEFENVTFGYTPEKTVLNEVTLTAQPGQKIAFVGSTGAGKTTIINLISRFYDPDNGKIRYDDINVTKIKKADLRHSMAMVLQDTHMFTGTVADNVRFGKLDATDEEVEAAAKLANADYFIRHLPDGYDTMITGDGENLSQGQRQLLAIARAAVANPPVLILDEATSSIDTRTEQLIEKGMDSLMQGRTVFVIAHRLSTVRNADMICVLEHGRIIERGTHGELIASKGKYYQLYTGAFELD